MIVVTENRPEFESDLYALFKAFFEKEKVRVTAEQKEYEELVSIHMQVLYQENTICFTWVKYEYSDVWDDFFTDGHGRIRRHALQEIVTKATSETTLPEKTITVDFSDHSDTKNKLKIALYELLSEYTEKKLPWGTLTGIRPTKIPMKFLEEGKSQEEILTYMKETYRASEEKAELSIAIAKRELSMLKKLDYENGYSLYVGIPFCPTTCLYCSFTSYPLSMWKERTDEYLNALEREMKFTAELYSAKKLNTIYIGGGTPTTLEPYQLDRLIRNIKSYFDLSHCLEFTVEAGRPDSITREKLEVLKKHGITRISINPQTMKPETLKLIGRHHTVEQTIESFQLARELGFDDINMDLIMGLPEETVEDAKATLEKIKELKPENLTVHSLALKRASRLKMFQDDYKKYEMINTQEHMELVAQYAKEMGLSPYYLYRQKSMAGNLENVGYAVEGKAGLYNILIMEEKQTIVALGAGASTKLVLPDGRIGRCENVKDVKNYIERIDEMIERKHKFFAENI